MVAYDSGGFPSAYGWRRDGDLWLQVPDVVTFHLPAGGVVLTAIPEETVDADAVLDAYHGAALPLVVQATRGLEALHASAVLAPTGRFVAAFCGASGSGKSTVAFGLTRRAWSHWADDAVAFRAAGAQSTTAVGLPFSVKLREEPSAYFGACVDGIHVIHEHQWTSAPLAAVFLLEPMDLGPSGGAVDVERLSPGAAVHRLLPNAFRFHPQTDARRRETMSSYLELVASVPVFGARYPRGLDRLPELLDELEARMSGLT